MPCYLESGKLKREPAHLDKFYKNRRDATTAKQFPITRRMVCWGDDEPATGEGAIVAAVGARVVGGVVSGRGVGAGDTVPLPTWKE